MSKGKEPEKKIIPITEIPNQTESIRQVMGNFFREYSNTQLIEGENPQVSEHNTTYRTPIITGLEGRAYQAESCFQDYGPMGEAFEGRIIIVEDMEKANKYAAQTVPRLNLNIYDPSFIARCYNEKNGLIDLLEIPFLSGLDNYRIIKEPWVSYDPETREENGIENLLERI